MSSAPGTAGATGAAGATAGSAESGGSELMFDSSALDAAVQEVAAHAQTWATTPAGARADLLNRVLRDTMAASDDLASRCM